MWQREQLSLKRHLSDISFNIQELRVMLDELYMNEEFENDNKWAYERVINSLDKLFVIRKDFEKLTEKVEENDV
jgi:ligand-binding sensor protein|tara:strand:+ start:83 stop:304 length:222 start_codon:yes stop_codon:yes gene_type:complete